MHIGDTNMHYKLQGVVRARLGKDGHKQGKKEEKA
jgi:hypothetical protein